MWMWVCVPVCIRVCERAFTSLLGGSKIRILVIFFFLLFIANFWGFLFACQLWYSVDLAMQSWRNGSPHVPRNPDRTFTLSLLNTVKTSLSRRLATQYCKKHAEQPVLVRVTHSR